MVALFMTDSRAGALLSQTQLMHYSGQMGEHIYTQIHISVYLHEYIRELHNNRSILCANEIFEECSAFVSVNINYKMICVCVCPYKYNLLCMVVPCVYAFTLLFALRFVLLSVEIRKYVLSICK